MAQLSAGWAQGSAAAAPVTLAAQQPAAFSMLKRRGALHQTQPAGGPAAAFGKPAARLQPRRLLRFQAAGQDPFSSKLLSSDLFIKDLLE